MKTNVIMTRRMGDLEVHQRTKDMMFNATSLLKQWNECSGQIKKMSHFLENSSTKELIEEMMEDEDTLRRNPVKSCKSGSYDSIYIKVKGNRTKGISDTYWMHPYLFIDFAMWLNPRFKLKVIKFVYDNLIEFRNQAGDYFVDMVASIKDSYMNYFGKEPKQHIYINETRLVNKLVYGEAKGGKRDISTEKELDRLNRLQLANIRLIESGVGKKARIAELEKFSELLG